MTTTETTTYFHYSGDKVIYETDGSNNITAEYTWDVNGNPVSMTKNGVTYYYHLNGHGDVMELTDASGTVVAQYQYDAWGNILSQSGTMASVNPYRYAGYRYDESTGLYYLMARYYDAGVGRFITRDSFHGFADETQSINQYAYAYNNPVTYIDPTGHLAIKFDKNFYLGSGTTLRLRVFGSTWNGGWNGSISGNLKISLTWGGLGLLAASSVSGFTVKRLAVAWIERNTFLKERIKEIFKISAISALVYNQITGLVSKAIKKGIKLADNAIMKIPGSTKVAFTDTIRYSRNW